MCGKYLDFLRYTFYRFIDAEDSFDGVTIRQRVFELAVLRKINFLETCGCTLTRGVVEVSHIAVVSRVIVGDKLSACIGGHRHFHRRNILGSSVGFEHNIQHICNNAFTSCLSDSNGVGKVLLLAAENHINTAVDERKLRNSQY